MSSARNLGISLLLMEMVRLKVNRIMRNIRNRYSDEKDTNPLAAAAAGGGFPNQGRQPTVSNRRCYGEPIYPKMDT
jgi:hypothetical protein